MHDLQNDTNNQIRDILKFFNGTKGFFHYKGSYDPNTQFCFINITDNCLLFI